MSGPHQSGAYFGAALIEHRLDIVQIENRGFAATAQLFDIRRAPGVFHDSEIVAPAGDRAFVAWAPRPWRRDPPGADALNSPPGIAKIARHQAPAVIRERDHMLVAAPDRRVEALVRRCSRSESGRLRRSGQSNAAGTRSGTRPPPVKRIRGLRRKHQGVHSTCFPSQVEL